MPRPARSVTRLTTGLTTRLTSGLTACLLALLPAASQPAVAAEPPPAAQIPATFHGAWAGMGRGCKPNGPSGELALTVSADALWFYEGGGPVERVRVNGPADVTVDVRMGGEGQTWRQEVRLGLSDDGRVLRTTGMGDGPVVRYRCR